MTAASGGCPVTVVWDPAFAEYDFGPGHPFTEASRAAAVGLLESNGFFRNPAAFREASVPPAPSEILERFHRPSYLRFVRAASASGSPGPLDQGDTPAFPGCFEAAARIVGGTVRAREAIRQRPGSHAFAPAGGLHHAHPERASGFCIFNDLAAVLAGELGAGQRVAYVDIDAHHGDGVMYGFFRDGRLLDVDLHQDGRTLFPGTGALAETGEGDGAGTKVNLPLPPGAGDREFAELFDRIVPTLLREHRPGLIVLQSGVDGHADDPLAQLRYTARSYRHAYARLHDLAHELCGGRLLVTGGGGYDAGHVSEVLATAAYYLADRAGEIPGGRELPSEWRRAFAEQFGTDAPRSWSRIGAPAEVPRRSPAAERLIGELERHLGRRFPVAGG
jgi:acetoin utilization protein AcuC